MERMYGRGFADMSVREEYEEMVEDAGMGKGKMKGGEFLERVGEMELEWG
ncbi:hypothetical protein [Corynebacterium glyciniphilum]|nr:hypothetical protein [Corynebacterium glyciniphilum]